MNGNRSQFYEWEKSHSVRSGAGKACGRGLGRRVGVDGYIAGTDPVRLGLAASANFSKTAERQRGPSNASRCVGPFPVSLRLFIQMRRRLPQPPFDPALLIRR
jgi:hypothetical protein